MTDVEDNNLELHYISKKVGLIEFVRGLLSSLEKLYNTLVTLELLQTIAKLKPSSSKGTYFKGIHVSSTMSPGITVDVKSVPGI